MVPLNRAPSTITTMPALRLPSTTEEALSSHGGGYETRLTSYSNLEPTAGRQMVEAALELAGRMKPGRLPEPPQAPSFKSGEDGIGSGAWSYGNVPPELS